MTAPGDTPGRTVLIRGGTVLTMNPAHEIVRGDVLVRGARIAAIGRTPVGRPDDTIDAEGCAVIPGFVQTHLHLCQTLFRGLADELPLLEWLRRRVWPLEAAHTPASVRASADLAATELIAGGTTSILTMETVRHTEVAFESMRAAGLRATIGKCMMDTGENVPGALLEDTAASLRQSLELHAAWHGREDGRLRAAFAPRFALSCSARLLGEVAAAARARRLLVHTHAAESRAEVALVREATGAGNIAYYERLGLADASLCVAHCVWLEKAEQALLQERGVKVLHCPGSNLKLGSGIAPVVELRRRGVCVSLGADSAACNNTLDQFQEMRLAATLQAMRLGPGSLTAADALAMATLEGARALGLADEIGSIEVGKRADLAVVNLRAPHMAPAADPYAALVFSGRPSDVRATLVDGRPLYRDGRHATVDAAEVVARARLETAALVARAGI